MSATAQVDTPLSGLRAFAPEALPFATSLQIRAFLLQREHGNVLVYSVGGLEREARTIDELGGVSRQYLNHWHEAMFASDWTQAPLFVHADDRASVESSGRHVRGSFSRRHTLDDDFEVIPTPGHTDGATAYLWDSGANRLLFTGDTLVLDEGEWVPAVLASSDRSRYLESLELIRELDFDVLVPWAATADQPYYAITDPADTRRRIDAALERVGRACR